MAVGFSVYIYITMVTTVWSLHRCGQSCRELTNQIAEGSMQAAEMAVLWSPWRCCFRIVLWL